MSEQFGGLLWLIMDVAMVAVLGVAMVYGIFYWRKRRLSRLEKAAQDRGVERVYKQSTAD